MNVNEHFREAMLASGLTCSQPIIADGNIHRFKSQGDCNRNSWYVLHNDPPAAGAFGCWKRNIKHTWCDRSHRLTSEEQNRVSKRWEEAERDRRRLEDKSHSDARKLAAGTMDRSTPADSTHPYLAQKEVEAIGELRLSRQALVLPLRDHHGELHSLQFIRENGSKRFLPGGRITGCCYVVSDNPEGPLVICEGYATGASIYQATGRAVVCAMNAGNLIAVAPELRQAHPDREIVLAADNDAFTTVNGETRNAGFDAAMAAARQIDAKVAVPYFEDVSTKPTDFNDLHRLSGLPEVARQLDAAIAPSISSDSDLPTSEENDIPPTIPPTIPPEEDHSEVSTPPFPTQCLPPDMADMVHEVAESLRVPDSLPALMALAIVAGSIGKGLSLDWRPGKSPTPANLFIIPTAESGSGKSECFKMLAAAFLAFERQLQDHWHAEVSPALQADIRFHEGQLKKLDRKLTKDSTSSDEAVRLRTETKHHLAQVEKLKSQLSEPKLSLQDATIEKAAVVMQSNQETAFSQSSDARKLVDNILGRYASNKNLADDSIYLNAYSGDAVMVDRQGRESVRLDSPCLTLLWALQPDALNMLLDEQSLQQGGFLGRCLMAHTHAEPQHVNGQSKPVSEDSHPSVGKPRDPPPQYIPIGRRIHAEYRSTMKHTPNEPADCESDIRSQRGTRSLLQRDRRSPTQWRAGGRGPVCVSMVRTGSPS